MGELKDAMEESADEFGKESWALVAGAAAAPWLEGSLIPEGSAVLGPLVAAAWPMMRWEARRLVRPLIDYARECSRLRNEAFDGEIESDPRLEDMVAILLQEIGTNTADPQHLGQVAAVLGHAVASDPEERVLARQILQGLAGLTSRHVKFLERVAGRSPRGEWTGGWSGDEVEAEFDPTWGNWRFDATALDAVGFIRLGGYRTTDFGASLSESQIVVTPPGRWALDVLDAMPPMQPDRT